MLRIVMILAASMLPSGTAHAAQESSATRRQNDLSVRPFAVVVTEASKPFGVPEHWIRAELRARYGLGTDPFDPRDNIRAGAAYVRELYDRYGVPGFLAAYNAGPGRYERHLATGRPLPDETQAYVATLAPMINRADQHADW